MRWFAVVGSVRKLHVDTLTTSGRGASHRTLLGWDVESHRFVCRPPPAAPPLLAVQQACPGSTAPVLAMLSFTAIVTMLLKEKVAVYNASVAMPRVGGMAAGCLCALSKSCPLASQCAVCYVYS